MISKTRVMIYVEDVEVNATFWIDAIGAVEIERQPLPESFTAVTLRVTQDFELGLFPKAFIAKYSPEVLKNIPSIMFYPEDFEGLHERIKTANPVVDMGGMMTFNFTDPDGNYFAVGKR